MKLDDKYGFGGIALFLTLTVLPLVLGGGYAVLHSTGLAGIGAGGFTLSHWAEVLSGREWWRSLGFSVLVAALSIGLSLGLALGYTLLSLGLNQLIQPPGIYLDDWRVLMQPAIAYALPAVLASLIASQEGFLQYLLLLLSDGALNAAWSGGLDTDPFGESSGRQRKAYELPLLESLLRSLSRNPVDLTRVGDLLSDLRRTPEGARLVPEQFVQLWEPISAVLAQRAGERA